MEPPNKGHFGGNNNLSLEERLSLCQRVPYWETIERKRGERSEGVKIIWEFSGHQAGKSERLVGAKVKLKERRE